jgi:two-component sensor histidine kinase
MFKILYIGLICWLTLPGAVAQQALPDSLQKMINRAPNDSLLTEAYLTAGEYYYQQYNASGYSKAADYFEKGRQIAVRSGDSTLIGFAHLALGQVYDAIGDESLPKALEYYKLFANVMANCKDTPIILRSHFNIAHTYMRMKMAAPCLAAIKRMTDIAGAYNRIMNNNLTHVSAAFLCTQIQRFDLSRYYFDKIDTTHHKIKNASLGYLNWYLLTRFYLLGAEKKYAQAFAAGNDALRISVNRSDSMTIFGFLAKLAVQAGEHKMAYDFKIQELNLYKEITKDNSFATANTILLKSELALKEENRQLLIKQQQTQRRYNFWLVIGVIFLSVALAIIIWLYEARRKKNKQLKIQVEENRLLLQELHHRVKNNLQIVNSFLLLEENKPNGGGKIFIKEMQSKIHAMALLHQKLLGAEHFDEILLQPYFEQLANSILASHTLEEQEISCSIDAGDAMLKQDKLISLALITTELLLNSIKYVAAQQSCHIHIGILQQPSAIAFTYTDNGQGLPNSFSFDKVSSTGLLLVKQLCKQLKAEIAVLQQTGKNGFAITIPTTKAVS